MLTSLKSLRGLSWRVSLVSLVLISGLAACSPVMSGLSSLTGSGTNVAANTQLGQQNNQTLGTSETTTNTFKVSEVDKIEVSKLDQSKSDSKLEAQTVENVNFFSGVPLWYWLALFIAAWVDSPKRWPGQVWHGWRRFKDRNK